MATPRSTLATVMLVSFMSTAGVALPYPVLAPFFLRPDAGGLTAFAGVPAKLLLGVLLAVYPLGILVGNSFLDHFDVELRFSSDRAEPTQGTLGPNQSAWYMFYVPQEYPAKQIRKDADNGVIITPRLSAWRCSRCSRSSSCEWNATVPLRARTIRLR